MPETKVDSILFPVAPVIVVAHDRATMLTSDGELQVLSLEDAAAVSQDAKPIVCHRTATFARLRIGAPIALDVLELLAFVKPGRFCPPTPPGLAAILGLPAPASVDDQPATVLKVARRLLEDLRDLPTEDRHGISAIAKAMAFGGWPWGSFVLSALGETGGTAAPNSSDLAVWRSLPEWEETPPLPRAGDKPIEENEIRTRLTELLGPLAEPRPQQHEYAAELADAFAPPIHEDEPRLVVAEAGTGVGKTLGYLAPADLWAKRNKGTVWFSTYTRNLQHQIDEEASRIFPGPDEKYRQVVVRKGRENYLCLLNFEERVRSASLAPNYFVPLGLMARWISVTRDGDLTGPDFPSWIRELFDWELTAGLADRRGECVYAACSHYRRCFIEATVRRARQAEFVIANHALVLMQSALGGGEDMNRVTRFVFDEGHHLFDAADNAFSRHLTGRETADLRRWLLGPEGRRGSRGRGLRRRLEGLISGDAEAERSLDDIARVAASLPAPGWLSRLRNDGGNGPIERFLTRVRAQVLARNREADTPYSLESGVHPVEDSLSIASREAIGAFRDLLAPLAKLSTRLQNRLDEDASKLDTDTRRRMEGILRTLNHRAVLQARGWIDMLDSVISSQAPEVIDWLSIDRAEGREMDIGMHRHWLDPMQPFADVVARKAHGIVVTSATLRDDTRQPEADWRTADLRTGATYISDSPRRISIPSPFDFPNQTRVFALNDIQTNTQQQVAAAFRELFIAANGGALGIFTAISRLRDIYQRIVGPLEQAGLPLYAQHVDALSNSTLVEMFRADSNSCLLGTDAMRDGVDIPGDTLRLLVFDRVPWARRSILHHARRQHFGPAGAYDDMIARLRIKQAFGRLIRRADDKGVFVMVDSRLPSRLHTAFPEHVNVERIGLADAIAEIRTFLA